MWKLKFPRKIQILSALGWPSSKAPDLPWHPQWLPWVPPIVGGLLTIRLGAQILLTGDELAKTFLERSSFLPHVPDLTSIKSKEHIINILHISCLPMQWLHTGKSLSEALILASTNPQYDDRLFIELQV